MAATPILDLLSVQLAERLGDPYKPEGGAVTVEDDGITYSALHRCRYITQSLRMLMNTLGHAQLEEAGFVRWYGVRFVIASESLDLTSAAVEGSTPAYKLARIYLVTLYGRPVRQCPWSQQDKINSLLWQNVPMWRIEPGNTLVIFNGRVGEAEDPWPSEACIGYGIRDIPDFVPHDGETNPNPEDVLLSSYFHSWILDLAEVIGRRNHQEAHEYVRSRRQEVGTELDRFIQKENS